MNKKLGHNNFNKYPEKEIFGHIALEGWEAIRAELSLVLGRGVLVAEFYPGANRDEIVAELGKLGAHMMNAEEFAMSDEKYHNLVDCFLTDDRVFGLVNTITLNDIYPEENLEKARKKIKETQGPIILYGMGASLITTGETLVYFDMPRWEIQLRFAKGMPNWKTDNATGDKLKKFKQGFFLEWRMADRQKSYLFDKINYTVDSSVACEPKMISGDAFREGLRQFASQPFRLVPYYAPEVWGGQWMKTVCGLDESVENYAWSFDGVPEENSIRMRFGEVCVELPAINVVLYCPQQLLGDRVHARFGAEFPIRFNFLDTMGGQNLSLQVHPITEYIQNTFGMHYTQEESYYILDSADDAVIYLGVQEGVDKGEMLADLHAAQAGGAPFDADKHINVMPAKKHDHFLIPAGTIHCSGHDTMVLEISSSVYIFTFKLWDWGRVGLDGKPRPVHLQHGEKVIQWDRKTQWIKDNLVGRVEEVGRQEGLLEERTGLHEREFIETRRYTLSSRQKFKNEGSVSVCNVVEGAGAIVSSVDGSFEPYEVHYVETFILPASIKEFYLEPLGEECKIMRAWVR